MAFKLLWDFSIYWSINALRFVNGKVTDMAFTQAILPHLLAVFELTARMQELFKDWHRRMVSSGSGPSQRPGFVATNNIPIVHDKQARLDTTVPDDELKQLFAENAEFLRALAVLIFHQAVRSTGQTLDESQPIDPLKIGLDAERWPEDLFADDGMSLQRARELAPGVEEHWLDQAPVAT